MKLKDPKTSSTSESPKIKLALEEKYNEENKKADEAVDKHNSIKDKESSKLPQPTGWRLLVLPFKAKVEFIWLMNLLKDHKSLRLADSFFPWDHIVITRKNFLKVLGARRVIG